MADTMRASRLDPLWADYEAHHRTAGNKWCHAAGIPLILAGLLGLLSVPVLTVEGARVEAALLLIAVMAGRHPAALPGGAAARLARRARAAPCRLDSPVHRPRALREALTGVLPQPLAP